ncbi:MAG: hypothetical protein DRJ38_09240, partial [Thermoprotei archaeon]
MQPLLRLSEARQRNVHILEKKLKDCKDGELVKVRARIVRAKIKFSRDGLGKRPRISGILEDDSFRAFFVSYNPNLPLVTDAVVEIEGALVRRLPSGNKILLLNERTKVSVLGEGLEKYIFNARIADLDEPVSGILVEGRIAHVYDVVVKKCRVCNKQFYGNVCPEGHQEGFYYDLRLKFLLSDDTGSIKCIAPRDISAKLLGVPISYVYDTLYEGECYGTIFLLKPKNELRLRFYSGDIENGRYYRDNKGLIIVLDCEEPPDNAKFVREKVIDFNSVEDLGLLADVVEHYIRSRLPEEFLGFHLLRRVHTNYRKVYLYEGFNLEVEIDEPLKVTTTATVRAFESLKDYINYRRRKGASYNAVKRTILNYRNIVYLAPRGLIGKIVSLIPVSASEYIIEEKGISIYEYWRRKGFEVDRDEKPLVKVRVYDLGGLELVYPPSQVFYKYDNISRNSYFYTQALEHAHKYSKNL